MRLCVANKKLNYTPQRERAWFPINQQSAKLHAFCVRQTTKLCGSVVYYQDVSITSFLFSCCESVDVVKTTLPSSEKQQNKTKIIM